MSERTVEYILIDTGSESNRAMMSDVGRMENATQITKTYEPKNLLIDKLIRLHFSYRIACHIDLPFKTIWNKYSVLLRMTVFSGSVVYRNNALMNANLFTLGMAFVIFGLFNWIFVGGFFKTAYKFARPFVIFIVFNFLLIFAAEALHHVPGLESLNAFGTDRLALQLILFVAGVLIFLVMTVLACRNACRNFERIDL